MSGRTRNSHACTMRGVWSCIAKGLGILLLYLVAVSAREGVLDALIVGSIAVCLVAMAAVTLGAVLQAVGSFLFRKLSRA